MTAPSRLRPITLAYVTSGFSKVATAAVQLLALPVVAASLGAERFGGMLVLASLAALLSVPAQGLPSSASFAISRTLGRGLAEQVRREYWSSAALAFAIGTMMLGVAAIAGWMADPAWLLGPGVAAFRPELDLAFAAVAFHVAVSCFFPFVEGARAAYQENHLTNLFSLAASLAVLGAVVLCWRFAPTIGAFYCAIFVIPPLFQGLNLLFFHLKRRSALGMPTVSRQTLRQHLRRVFDYGTAQAGISLYLHGTVYLAAQFISLSAGAIVGGMVRLLVIFQSVFVSALNPVLPTISLSMAIGDRDWIEKSIRFLSLLLLPALLLTSAAIAFSGEQIMFHWLRLDLLNAPFTFLMFGLMALFYSGSHLQYLVLLALGDSKWSSRFLLAAGTVGAAAGYFAGRSHGLIGLAAAQSAAMMLLAFFPFAVRIRWHLKQQASAPAV